jgi:hypothetical protein
MDFPSGSFYYHFRFFFYIFRLWTVANLNGGVEEGDLHAQAHGFVPELNLSSAGMLK